MSSLLERLVRAIELGAAAFLAAVTGVMFVSVFLRYLFSCSIPDSYDCVRLVLGILILWGMAGTSYRGEHITVDLLWGALPRGGRIALDIFATVVTLAGLGVFAWMMGTKVLSTFEDNVVTYDLQLPVWIYYLVAWAGLAAAAVLVLARLVRLFGAPDSVERAPHAHTAE